MIRKAIAASEESERDRLNSIKSQKKQTMDKKREQLQREQLQQEQILQSAFKTHHAEMQKEE